MSKIQMSVEQNSKSNKNAARRMLDAERISEDISDIVSKIQEADIRFLVRKFAEVCALTSCSPPYQQMRTAVSTENKVDDVRHELAEQQQLGEGIRADRFRDLPNSCVHRSSSTLAPSTCRVP
jgi:hypothetical protein